MLRYLHSKLNAHSLRELCSGVSIAQLFLKVFCNLQPESYLDILLGCRTPGLELQPVRAPACLQLAELKSTRL